MLRSSPMCLVSINMDEMWALICTEVGSWRESMEGDGYVNLEDSSDTQKTKGIKSPGKL